MRKFETGATRSPIGDKLRYADFLDSRVIKRYCQYMHKHRVQADGQVREPNNWKKGVDRASLVDSLNRHQMDVLMWYHGYEDEMEEPIEEALCAVMFNTMALLDAVLKEQDKVRNIKEFEYGFKLADDYCKQYVTENLETKLFTKECRCSD